MWVAFTPPNKPPTPVGHITYLVSASVVRPLALAQATTHHSGQHSCQRLAISQCSRLNSIGPYQFQGPCCRSSRRSAGTPLCTRAARPRPPLAPWADPRLRTRQPSPRSSPALSPGTQQLRNHLRLVRNTPPNFTEAPGCLHTPHCHTSPAGSSRHSKHGRTRPRKSGSTCLHMLRPRVSSEHMWHFTQFTRAARHTFPSLSTFTFCASCKYSKLVNARPFFANASLLSSQ